jgi:hypothetical protein
MSEALMAGKSLRFVLLGGMLALSACSTDPHRADGRLGQNDEYDSDYREIYPYVPYVRPSGTGSWVGSNKGHR